MYISLITRTKDKQNTEGIKMLTKLRIYNLAYVALLKRLDKERNRYSESLHSSIIRNNLIERYRAEIEELRTLILAEKGKIEREVTR